MYYKIAQSGELSLIAKNGVLDEHCEKIWNDILARDSRTNGSLTMLHQINDYTVLKNLTRDFVLVRGALLKLSFVVDDECLKMLAQKGFKVSTDTATNYSKSLSECIKRSDSFTTRITMKRNEIIGKYGGKKEAVFQSYEEIVADLNVALGFVVEPNITLASFNEYRRVLKTRNGNHK